MKVKKNRFITNILALSRWKEYFFLMVILTWLPVVLGEAQADWRLVVLFGANLFGLAFAFMINEVEDAEDDKKDKKRNLTNPVALGQMSYSTGWWVSMLAGGLSVVLYAVLGRGVFWVGVVNFGLALTYSWKKVRLKSMPVVDLVSHGLTLGGMQYWAGYLVYGGNGWVAAWLFLAIVLMSMVGQVYNQIRDFEADRSAGLRNTASLVGLGGSKALRWFCILLSAVAVGLVWREGVFPGYIIWVSLVVLVVFKLMGVGTVKTSREERLELASQRLMVDTVLALDVIVMIWLVVKLGWETQAVRVAQVGVVGVVSLLRKLPLSEFVGRWI